MAPPRCVLPLDGYPLPGIRTSRLGARPLCLPEWRAHAREKQHDRALQSDEGQSAGNRPCPKARLHDTDRLAPTLLAGRAFLSTREQYGCVPQWHIEPGDE